MHWWGFETQNDRLAWTLIFITAQYMMLTNLEVLFKLLITSEMSRPKTINRYNNNKLKSIILMYLLYGYWWGFNTQNDRLDQTPIFITAQYMASHPSWNQKHNQSHQFVYLSMCRYVNVSVCRSVNVSVCRSVNVSMCQCVDLSMCRCVNV